MEYLLNAGKSLALILRNIITPLKIIRMQLANLKKTGFSTPNIDEGGLKPLFYTKDDAFVNIPFNLLFSAYFNVQLHQATIMNYGNTGLLGVHYINQHFLAYRCIHICGVPFRVPLQA